MIECSLSCALAEVVNETGGGRMSWAMRLAKAGAKKENDESSKLKKEENGESGNNQGKSTGVRLPAGVSSGK